METDSNAFFENLDIAFMISGEVRKGRWSVFTDLNYIDFSDDDSKVKSVDFGNMGRVLVGSINEIGTKTSLTGATWKLSGSYGVLQGDLGRLELLTGFRYFGLEASADTQVFPRSGSITESEEL